MSESHPSQTLTATWRSRQSTSSSRAGGLQEPKERQQVHLHVREASGRRQEQLKHGDPKGPARPEMPGGKRTPSQSSRAGDSVAYVAMIGNCKLSGWDLISSEEGGQDGRGEGKLAEGLVGQAEGTGV